MGRGTEGRKRTGGGGGGKQCSGKDQRKKKIPGFLFFQPCNNLKHLF
jgi:hypothetical protein